MASSNAFSKPSISDITPVISLECADLSIEAPSTIKKKPFLLRSSLLSALCCISANDGSSLEASIASGIFLSANKPRTLSLSDFDNSLLFVARS